MFVPPRYCLKDSKTLRQEGFFFLLNSQLKDFLIVLERPLYLLSCAVGETVSCEVSMIKIPSHHL